MTVSWYPKNIVIGLILLGAFALALQMAVDAWRGAAVGIAAIVVCTVVDLMLTVNPAVWKRRE